MENEKERLKAEIMARLSKKLDHVFETRVVTMSDIENVVGEFQRDAGKEIAEGVLDLKKTLLKKG